MGRDCDLDVRLPAQRSGLTLQQVGEDCVLYDEDARRVHVMNSTAILIWENCTGLCTLREVVAKILAIHADAQHDQVAADINEYVEQLRAENLVV